MATEPLVCIDLWPSHGKRVVVATTQAQLDAACASYAALPREEAEARRYATSVRLYRFDLGAPHAEHEWDDMHCDVLALACLRKVTQGKPLPVVLPPTPDPEASAWRRRGPTGGCVPTYCLAVVTEHGAPQSP